jgi:hypothetical protein
MDVFWIILIVIISLGLFAGIFIAVYFLIREISKSSGGWSVIQKYYAVNELPQGKLFKNPYFMAGKVGYRNIIDFVYNENGFGFKSNSRFFGFKPIFIEWHNVDKVVKKKFIVESIEIWIKMPVKGSITINNVIYSEIRKFLERNGNEV